MLCCAAMCALPERGLEVGMDFDNHPGIDYADISRHEASKRRRVEQPRSSSSTQAMPAGESCWLQQTERVPAYQSVA